MSPFMSSMPAAGLIERPPVSKHTPLPMKATGASLFLPPFQRMMTTRLSFRDPCPTPSNAFMPSFFIAGTSSTSTATPSFLSTAVRRANSSGNSTLAGSLIRSRAMITPSATGPLYESQAFLAAAALPTAIVICGFAGASSPSRRLVL